MENEIIINENYNDNFIDLRIIFNILMRGKFFIFIFTSLSLIFGSIYAYRQTNLWQGSFEIVLENETSSKNQNKSFIPSSIQSELGFSDEALATQVSILKSSSVLKPVYLFALNHKKNTGEDLKSLSYKNWVKAYLQVRLIKNTQILEIIYKDSDKQFIKPVLNKISETYQKYSTNKIRENLSTSIEFVSSELINKKEDFKNISNRLKSFQAEHNLGDYIVRGIPSSSPSGLGAERNDSVSLEKNSLIKINRFDYHYETLKKLEFELLEKYLNYKPNSKTIKSLKDRIEFLRESLNRPQEILFEYNNIIREYNKKELILSNLESELYSLLLERSKQLKPWELISEVTLDEYPLTDKKNIVIFFFTFGLIVSVLIKLLESQLSNIVYEIKDFSKILNCDLLLKLPRHGDKNWNDSINVFNAITNQSSDKSKLVIFILADNENYKLNDTINYLCKYLDSVENRITNEINKINESSQIIFIGCPGEITTNKIEIIKAKLKALNCSYLGWVYVETRN